MDEAFCRRLQVKFFVGRLDPEKRLKILLKIESVALSKGKPKFDKTKQHELLKKLTTNFSGAALESFRSRILSYLIKYDELTIYNEFLVEIADKVARDFQVTLGPNTIPILLQDFSRDASDDQLDLDHAKKSYTGKVLVDLSNEDFGVLQLEYELTKKGHLQTEIDAIELSRAKLTHDVISTLLKLSINENIDFIQMFDTSMLMNNAAFDDNTVMECVLEKLSEWQQYPRSMAIFDVDSLIGVSENMSDSSMGQSNSYSITNNRLWQQVVIQTVI